jgi:hypothetical protein
VNWGILPSDRGELPLDAMCRRKLTTSCPSFPQCLHPDATLRRRRFKGRHLVRHSPPTTRSMPGLVTEQRHLLQRRTKSRPWKAEPQVACVTSRLICSASSIASLC